MGLFGAKAARAATNAPRDWPEVGVRSWKAENPIELYLLVAAELKRGFDAEGRDVDFAFGRSRLCEDAPFCVLGNAVLFAREAPLFE